MLRMQLISSYKCASSWLSRCSNYLNELSCTSNMLWVGNTRRIILLVSARSPSDVSVRCDAPHLANIRVVKARDFGNKGQTKPDTIMVLEEQHAGVCLHLAALQESPWAGNDRRVLLVGLVVLHPHLEARKHWFRCTGGSSARGYLPPHLSWIA